MYLCYRFAIILVRIEAWRQTVLYKSGLKIVDDVWSGKPWFRGFLAPFPQFDNAGTGVSGLVAACKPAVEAVCQFPHVARRSLAGNQKSPNSGDS